MEWAVTSSVLILAVLALRFALKGKISLRLQYALWALVLLRLLLPVNFGHSRVSVLNAFPAEAPGIGVQGGPRAHAPVGPAVPSATAGYPGNAHSAEPAIPDGEAGGPDRAVDWTETAKTVWLAGAAAVGLCLLIANLRFAARLKRSRQSAEIEDCPLPVYVSGSVETPCLFGLFRPAIYVTDEALADAAALRHVLAHETTHFRHGDHLWAFLRCICLALHWYHPLVWLAASYAVRDAELACDEGTIRRIGEEGRTAYGRTLIGLTHTRRGAGALLHTATTMTGGKRGLQERIALMAKRPKTALCALCALLLVAAAAAGCTFTGAKQEGDEITPLTAEQVQQYNQTFEPFLPDGQGNLVLPDGQGNLGVNPLSHFLRPYYDRPENLHLGDFLRYYPSDALVTDEAEFKALKAEKGWPFGADVALGDMPVPIHKFSADTVNDALKKHMDITLDDLNGVGTDELIYLKSYDAYYNFTSDFAAGTFHCTQGETQGEIIRLYGETATLTLKKRGDGFLFVSHQPAGAGTGIPDGTGPVRVEAEGDIPDAVVDYARAFVELQLDEYNALGKDPLSGTGYAITDAKITGLVMMNTGTAGLDSGVNLYRLEYRLRPDRPDRVVLAGGMRMEEIDGERWITEWGSTGQPYLLLAWEDTGAERSWRRVGVTNTDAITQEYGTPEMLARYGNAFTAAAMELYQQSQIRTIGQVTAVYTLAEAPGHTAVWRVAELLTAELLEDLKAGQAGRTFTITEWRNLSVSADRMYDAWRITGEVELRYEGILSPIGGSDAMPEGEYVHASLGERYLKSEDGVYTLSSSAGEQQAVLQRPLLRPEDGVGIGAILDYADGERLIFHGYFGLFVYDLQAERITFAADLEKAVGTTVIQGSEGAAVRVSADGGTIQLFFSPEDREPLMAYTIDARTGNYRYGEHVPLEAYATSAPELYGRLSQGTLGELRYSDGEDSWLLFAAWDWAAEGTGT
ncbi:MAG: M56 family metallopeptidase [Clostridiales bacterium]|nr:M56 family metallopeptidase [Clostridiales bacterium]